MPKALVLGVNGQDGSYVAEALVRRGYEVVGAGRQPHSRYPGWLTGSRYAQLDLEHQDDLLALLHDTRPDVVFHTAAIHGAAGFHYEPVFAAMMAVNVTSMHTVLDYARQHHRDLRLVYANSSKIFPAPLSGSISEATPIAASCLYSIGKIASLELIRYYRKHHGIAASNLVLFNHESRRRPANFFVPILARGLAAAIADPQHRFEVKTLDFHGDWSSAEELMDIAIDISEKAPAEDFVLASGTTWHARTAAKQLFAQHHLDYTQHIVEALPPQPAGDSFQVCLDHLHARIGRRPGDLIAVVNDLLAAAQTA